MTRSPCLRCLGMVEAFLVFSSGVHGEETPKLFLYLVRACKPVATVAALEDKAPIWDDDVAAITSTATRWGRAAPRVIRCHRRAT